MPSHAADDVRTRRRSRRRWVLGGVLLGLVVLVLLALPLRSVPGDARAARTELTAALDALRSGDLAAARSSVAEARDHVDAAQDAGQGVGGDVWSRIPFLGTPVADSRHLVDALDDATSVAEIGIDLYPTVVGNKGGLYRNQQVDREALDTAIAGAQDIQAHLVSAESSLDQVKGTTPVIGATIAEQRDAAAARIDPAAATFTDLRPMLDELPAVLGFDGERSYLIALLNPSELRYSGGAALSFAPMTWDQGRVELGDPVAPADDPRLSERRTWRKVVGNNFHRSDSRVANATFAPSWSVSGEELLRAWRKARGEDHDGVLAIDVMALARLLGATGGMNTQGYGQLGERNLVETLVGSYDDYYPDATVQDAANSEVIPAFQAQLLEGGKFVEKGRALAESADNRNFATYFRDDAVQQGFAALGLDGDLATAAGDYLFVGTQNTNGSKSDYWQRRSVSLDVALAEDGSARNRLDVVVDNDSPPYELPVADDGSGYFTRWAGMALAVFLPEDVRVGKASLDGESFDPKVGRFYDHAFLTRSLLLEPTASGRLQLAYDVPEAASVDGSGNLTYRLAVDPQGTVVPASAAVTVRLPEGYRATSLPEGWRARGNTVRYRTDALDSSQEWAIRLEAD